MKTKGALIWDFNQPWSVEEDRTSASPGRARSRSSWKPRDSAILSTTW